MSIPLPRIKKVRLSSYTPIFASEIEFKIEKLLYILLGGNGIGKTTVLQSIVYCIGGPADGNIESKETKDRRWDRHYFRSRLDQPDIGEIEVTFLLGSDEVKLLRGFKSDKLLRLTINDDVLSDDVKTAESVFADYLTSYTAYSSIADFYFIIHKLCYLSERRENLAWDVEGQTRILMMLFSDTKIERKFRERRVTLKELDSKIRHATVNVNKLDKILSEYEVEDIATDVIRIDSSLEKKPTVSVRPIELIQKDFMQSNALLSEQKQVEKSLKLQLSNISSDIDTLREELATYENKFILERIEKLEAKEAQLAIHKLLHNQLCPACGSKSETLHLRALENFKQHQCTLCGTAQNIKQGKALPAIEIEITEKIQDKLQLELSLRNVSSAIEELEARTSDISLEISEYFLNKPDPVVFIDKASTNLRPKEIEKLREAYRVVFNEREFQRKQFEELKVELEHDYELYNKRSSKSLEKLGMLYTEYASEFLGTECSLVSSERTSKLVSLKLFVPRFNGKTRDEPNTCSEAQRFFLDIAFRMALIQLTGETSKSLGTFICETPENALDITYKDSVADMLEMFTKKNKNTLVISCNIQTDGIAYSLLTRVEKKPENRHKYYLNLLEYGKLSDVQSSIQGKMLLRKELNKLRK